MCIATTTLPLVSLRLSDTPVGYTPPVGYAVHTTLTYNQREASQPANIDYSHIGPRWSTSWVGFIQDDPAKPGAGVRRIAAGGGAYDYSGYNSSTGAFAPEIRTSTQLVLTAQNPITYERRFADGSKEIYAASNGADVAPRRIFLSKILDPHGNPLTLNYDANLRLVSIQDAIGQNTTFSYANANTWLITAITDPFGRKAQLAYDAQGRLSSITDAVGIVSRFDYSGNSADIVALHTPYGATRFAATTTATARSLDITDPLGNTSRTEFNASVTLAEDKSPSASWQAGKQGERNTFYWDGEAHASAPGNYTQARISHWLAGADNRVANVLESEKLPLQTRTWYLRDGQASSSVLNGAKQAAPNQVARLLPDGSTQLARIAYTASGNPSQTIDPVGRQVQTSYDPAGIDVTAVKRQTAAGQDTLAQYTYDPQTPHRPVSYTDAAGKTWRMGYNARGQLLTVTDPLGKTTTHVYDAKGYLTQTVNGKVQTSYSYDNVGRVASRTDSEGHTLRYQYDNLDRLTSITYPDGTSETYTWTHLDRTAVTDRLGKVTKYAYDANRNLISTTDPEGHVTQYGYDRANRLTSLTDANGNRTTWQRDIQGRVTAKTYPDGTKTSYAYDSAGRLSSQTDALGQTRKYSYAADDRPSGISYADPVNPTAAVALEWGQHYPRITKMTDGIGVTEYSYVAPGEQGAGQIKAEATPQGKIAYEYDALARVYRRLIERAIESRINAWQYDALGRISGESNSLGAWETRYLGQSSQPISLARQEGFIGNNVDPPMLTLSHGYEDNSGDRRLKSLTWQYYDPPLRCPAGMSISSPECMNWKQQQSISTAVNWRFDYQSDALGRLSRSQDARLSRTQNPSQAGTESQQSYAYDKADRLIESLGATRQENYTLDAAGNLTGQDLVAKDKAAWSWKAQTNANNQLSIAQQFQPRYDAAGQLLEDEQRHYQWDAAGNLIDHRQSHRPHHRDGLRRPEPAGADRRKSQRHGRANHSQIPVVRQRNLPANRPRQQHRCRVLQPRRSPPRPYRLLAVPKRPPRLDPRHADAARTAAKPPHLHRLRTDRLHLARKCAARQGLRRHVRAQALGAIPDAVPGV
ncbi:MAG: hypothetical protein LBE78_13555 [Burkholderiaceae bacterium]|jgi:YD repeat-containing protein|nr:hypothetical protein [Burkholderiaceae bacterium]